MSVLKSTINSMLNALNIKSSDRIILVKENGLADANFVVTNLMEKICSDSNAKMCLVIFHNTIGHYQNVAKKMGYNLLHAAECGDVIIVEPLKMIVDNISKNEKFSCINFLSNDKESIVKLLFEHIYKQLQTLLVKENVGHVYLVIDEISHLLDLCVDIKHVVTFLNYCTNLVKNDRISIVLACHVSNTSDEIISNNLKYAADLEIAVFALKTGKSQNVTGIIEVNRKNQDKEALLKTNIFHYKAYDRGIRTFAPGQSLNYLFK